MAENDPSQSDYSILKSAIYLSKEMMFKFLACSYRFKKQKVICKF